MQSKPMPASIKSLQAISFTLDHRLVSTFFPMPIVHTSARGSFLTTHDIIQEYPSVIFYSTKIWCSFAKVNCLVPSSTGSCTYSFFSLPLASICTSCLWLFLDRLHFKSPLILPPKGGHPRPSGSCRAPTTTCPDLPKPFTPAHHSPDVLRSMPHRPKPCLFVCLLFVHCSLLLL